MIGCDHMDFYEKFGVKKDKAIFMLIDMVLVLLGFFASIFVTAFVIINKYTAWTIVTNIALVLCYTGIIYYVSSGYKYNLNKYYIGAVASFSFFSLVSLTMRFREAWDLMMLAVIFGLSLVVIFTLDKPKLARIMLFLILGMSFVLSIYQTIDAIVDMVELGEAINGSVLAKITIFYSIWAPVIMSSVLLLCFDIKQDKLANDNK